MNRFASLSVVALTVILAATLAACPGGGELQGPRPEPPPRPQAEPAPPETHTVTLRAFLDDDGVLTIDKSVHFKPTLKHLDRLEWVCDCPEGAEFAVRDVRHLAIGPKSEEELESLLQAVAEGLPLEAPPFDPGDPFRAKVPPGFSAVPFQSEPYRGFDDDHEWKFTWVVKLEEQEVPWAPHFSGGRR